MAIDPKQDTAIRSEGAELFVQAYLMLEMGIIASMASRNMPGYDIIAHNLGSGQNCRIQVKYRRAINSDGMRVKNFDFDFLVYIAGNLGYIGNKVPLEQAERRPTEVFIIPVEEVKKRVGKRDLYRSPTRGNHEEYRSAWHLIKEHLEC